VPRRKARENAVGQKRWRVPRWRAASLSPWACARSEKSTAQDVADDEADAEGGQQSLQRFFASKSLRLYTQVGKALTGLNQRLIRVFPELAGFILDVCCPSLGGGAEVLRNSAAF
jgi:hypothetical protein